MKALEAQVEHTCAFSGSMSLLLLGRFSEESWRTEPRTEKSNATGGGGGAYLGIEVVGGLCEHLDAHVVQPSRVGQGGQAVDLD